MPISYNTSLSIADNRDAVSAAYDNLCAAEDDNRYRSLAQRLSVVGFEATIWGMYFFDGTKRLAVSAIRAEFAAVADLHRLAANSPNAGYANYGTTILAASTQTAVEYTIEVVNNYENAVQAQIDRYNTNVGAWNTIQSENLISITGFDDDSNGYYDRFTYAGPEAPDVDAQQAAVLAYLAGVKASEELQHALALACKAKLTSLMGSTPYAAKSLDCSGDMTAIDSVIFLYTPNTSSPYHAFDLLYGEIAGVSLTNPWAAEATLNSKYGSVSEYATWTQGVDEMIATWISTLADYLQTNGVGCTVLGYTAGNESSWEWSM